MSRWEVIVSCKEHERLNGETVVATKSHALERAKIILEYYCRPDFSKSFSKVKAQIYKRVKGKDVLSVELCN